MINGVEILNQCIIYEPAGIGTIILFILFLIGLLLIFYSLEKCEIKLFFIGSIILILQFIAGVFLEETTYQTFLNKPNKIQYTIEIKDDNAWKEIGPKYNVKEKFFENKEIYLIEGDYIDDNT